MMIETPAHPTRESERIPSLDFLRGIAILGILFINIENFAYADSWSPGKFGFNSPMDHSTRFWVYFLTQGKFYTMFALLFGIGFYMFLERLEKKGFGLQAMDIYARRLLWLFVIGIAHAYLIWSGDVLYHYAICGLLLFPFRSIKSKNLMLIVIFLGALQMVKSYEQTTRRQRWLIGYEKSMNVPKNEKTKDDLKRIQFWEGLRTINTADTSLLEAPKATYLSGLLETYNHAKAHKGLLYFQGLLFPTLIAMLLGIILFRSGIFLDYHLWKYYWLISLVIFFVGLMINYFRFYHWTYEYYNPVMNIWKGWLFTFPKEVLAVGYVLMLNGIYQKYLKGIKLKFISNIGRMALTNYIFQNTLLGLIFYGYGLSKFNQFSRFELIGIVAAVWIIQFVLSWQWMNKYNQGPLEWVWKKLTYSSFNKKKSK